MKFVIFKIIKYVWELWRFGEMDVEYLVSGKIFYSVSLIVRFSNIGNSFSIE